MHWQKQGWKLITNETISEREVRLYELYRNTDGFQIWDTSLKHFMKYSLALASHLKTRDVFMYLFWQQGMILICCCKFYKIIHRDMLYYNSPPKGHWKTMAVTPGIGLETYNHSRWPGSRTHCQAQRHHAKQCICQVRNTTHFLAPLWLQPIFKEPTLSFSEPFCLAYQVVTFDLIESWFAVHGNSSLINRKWYT